MGPTERTKPPRPEPAATLIEGYKRNYLESHSQVQNVPLAEQG